MGVRNKYLSRVFLPQPTWGDEEWYGQMGERLVYGGRGGGKCCCRHLRMGAVRELPAGAESWLSRSGALRAPEARPRNKTIRTCGIHTCIGKLPARLLADNEAHITWVRGYALLNGVPFDLKTDPGRRFGVPIRALIGNDCQGLNPVSLECTLCIPLS